MENNQTAVELLAQLLGLMSSNPLVKQAKEMEKQQILDAYDEGYIDRGYEDHRANHYYNETFK